MRGSPSTCAAAAKRQAAASAMPAVAARVANARTCCRTVGLAVQDWGSPTTDAYETNPAASCAPGGLDQEKGPGNETGMARPKIICVLAPAPPRPHLAQQLRCSGLRDAARFVCKARLKVRHNLCLLAWFRARPGPRLVKHRQGATRSLWIDGAPSTRQPIRQAGRKICRQSKIRGAFIMNRHVRTQQGA
eukprot:364319-Chlamydomonas_euryale.AAC.1